jgi:hypothetical protein
VVTRLGVTQAQSRRNYYCCCSPAKGHADVSPIRARRPRRVGDNQHDRLAGEDCRTAPANQASNLVEARPRLAVSRPSAAPQAGER